jgi:para-nitrobenzyl esterase
MLNKLLNSALLVTSISASLSVAHAATLKTEQGILQGTQENNIDIYRGVPYAAPPVKENRWRLPQPPASWQGVRSATHFAASCQQTLSSGFGPYTREYMVDGPVSEDCLYLNIWRPSHTPATRLPVMVWIHGGGFTSGSGSTPIYDGAALASRGMIVITINYRLGVFGFLAHPSLTREGQGSGNYGIADIIAALKWVNRNIDAMGGDKNRITVAGQSAGSMSIHDLMVSPAAKPLFTRAISESGPGMGRPPASLASAEVTGQQFMRSAGVTTLEQLRQLPAEKLMAADQKMGPGLLRFAPVIDGKLIPVDPYSNLAGTYHDTPLLAGMNADESFSLPEKTLAGVKQDIKQIFADSAPQATRLYQPEQAVNYSQLNQQIRRERGLASTLKWADARVKSGDQPLYLYQFTHVEPGTEEWGVFHTSEVPYALGNLHVPSSRQFSAEDDKVSSVVSTYWVNFIKTGNPNDGNLPEWRTFDANAPQMMMLNSSPAMQPIFTPEKLAFYQQLIAQGKAFSLF